jgi:acyl-CoA synthetase (AMP-forming)/AMP-acid ligase II
VDSLAGLPGPAVLTEAARQSWPELLELTSSASRWLDRLDVPAGSPVAALLVTSADSIALALAGAGSWRPLAPLGPRLTERELVPCLQGIGARVLVADPRFAAIGERVAAGAGVPLALLDGFAAGLAAGGTGTAGGTGAGAVGMEDVGSILHTSGTTGLPKPVAMTQRTLAQRVVVNARLLQLDTDSVYASASPFHHIAGWGNVAVALGAGATIVPFPDFTVAAWPQLGELGVTHALLVPTMIEMLLAQGTLRLGSLRVLQYGAAPIHPDTLRRAMSVLPGVTFVDIYGQTEGSPLTCLTAEDHRQAAAGREYLLESVGRPVPGVELRIASPAADGVGELLARGPHLNYTDADGWQHTGDLGWLDDDGYLYLAGRKGDMIIRGGENVYPLEVENVLADHPQVAGVAVIGVPDQRLGEAVKAYIVPAATDTPPDFGELRGFARRALAGFKVPELWELTASLPHNANGKLMRSELVKRAAAADGDAAAVRTG